MMGATDVTAEPVEVMVAVLESIEAGTEGATGAAEGDGVLPELYPAGGAVAWAEAQGTRASEAMNKGHKSRMIFMPASLWP